MKILVTGADGQLGRSLPAALAGHEIISCNRQMLAISDNAQTAEVIGRHRPEWVINAAAWNQVDAAETEVSAAYRVNAAGPRNLAEATAALGAGLIHVSTDYVFDGTAPKKMHAPPLLDGLACHAA